jgi:hypothetical protein
VVTAALFVPLPNQYRALWTRSVLNACHLPAFALLTWCALRGWRVRRPTAILALGGLAVLAELGQAFVGRSVSALDIARGWTGIGLALLLMRAGHRDPAPGRRWVTRAALALLCWPLVEGVPAVYDALLAWRSFPTLADFSTPWQVERWLVLDGELKRVPCSNSPSGWAGQLTGHPGRERFGCVLFPVVSDWSQYGRLHVRFELPRAPARILLSVRDGRRVLPPARRFDRIERYPPGVHECVIDLRELAAGGKFAPLRIDQVQSFHLHVTKSQSGQSLLIYSLALE